MLHLSYWSYTVTETDHWSDILRSTGCGNIQKCYAFFDISQKDCTAVKYAVKTMVLFAGNTIFVQFCIICFGEMLKFHFFVCVIMWSLVTLNLSHQCIMFKNYIKLFLEKKSLQIKWKVQYKTYFWVLPISLHPLRIFSRG